MSIQRTGRILTAPTITIIVIIVIIGFGWIREVLYVYCSDAVHDYLETVSKGAERGNIRLMIHKFSSASRLAVLDIEGLNNSHGGAWIIQHFGIKVTLEKIISCYEFITVNIYMHK